VANAPFTAARSNIWCSEGHPAVTAAFQLHGAKHPPDDSKPKSPSPARLAGIWLPISTAVYVIDILGSLFSAGLIDPNQGLLDETPDPTALQCRDTFRKN
jgi:hypothetical protein